MKTNFLNVYGLCGQCSRKKKKERKKKKKNLFRKGIKMKIFLLFTIIYPKINMNAVKTICLSNNLPMHIRENTDFLRQLPSAKANFEGCVTHTMCT